MGRTPKPLKILVTEADLLELPEIKALGAKGHTLDTLTQEADIVMGRKAWYFDLRHHTKMLKDIIQEAWARVYPSKEV